MYACLHGINEQATDQVDELVGNLAACPGVNVGDTLERGTRISMTIRNVGTVKKMPRIGLGRQ